jgi:protein tyrosine phosphatase
VLLQQELQVSDNLVERKFIITKKGAGQRLLTQYNFLTWPDHGVPRDNQQLLELLNVVWLNTAHYKSPILVHCSAGVGRTGTFCVIDAAIRMVRNSPSLLDSDEDLVMNLIKTYRAQRCSIVETSVQNIFHS